MLPQNGPSDREVARYTDHYFTRTRKAIGRFGDARVTYALFMRRPVCFAPRLMIEWLEAVAAERSTEFTIDCQFEEGEWVGAGEPLIYLSGSFPPSRRPGDALPAEAGRRLRRRLQRLRHGTHSPQGRIPGDGRAPLRRPGDGRDDGLCRERRLQGSEAGVRRRRLHRQCDGCDRPLLRQSAGLRHDAPRLHRLRGLNAARGRDVSRRIRGRADDRARRLLRAGDHRHARRV